MVSSESYVGRSISAPKQYLILADHGDPGLFVGRRRRIDGGLTWLDSSLWRKPGFRLVRMFLRGTRAWWRTLRVDGPVVIVTYGAGVGFILAFWQAVTKKLRRPVTHFMFDLLLDDKRSGAVGIVDDIKTWVINSAVSGAAVWGKSDVARFAMEFGIHRKRLLFHPYHITLDDIPGFHCDVRDDGFIFCGGNVGRDFESVIKAVGPLGYPVVIATQVPGIAESAANYPNITVNGVTPEVFRQVLARSTFMIESHPTDFFRTAGHQTMLNAHYFGKTVVLADSESAEGYVRDGIDGLVVPSGDVSRLREAVRTLWEDQELRARLAARGQAKARRPLYATVNHMQSVYNLAVRHDCRQRGVSFKGYRIEVY